MIGRIYVINPTELTDAGLNGDISKRIHLQNGSKLPLNVSEQLHIHCLHGPLTQLLSERQSERKIKKEKTERKREREGCWERHRERDSYTVLEKAALMISCLLKTCGREVITTTKVRRNHFGTRGMNKMAVVKSLAKWQRSLYCYGTQLCGS